MPKRDSDNYKSFDVMLPQGARSRYDKALKAIDAVEDLLPDDALDGKAQNLREAIKQLNTATENLAELMAYRKMLGVD